MCTGQPTTAFQTTDRTRTAVVTLADETWGPRLVWRYRPEPGALFVLLFRLRDLDLQCAVAHRTSTNDSADLEITQLRSGCEGTNPSPSAVEV